MATIKSYTDLEQSRKLAKILPLESADMHYCLEKRDVATGYEIGVTPFIKVKRFEGKGNIVNIQPAWSLAALRGVLPKSGKYEPFIDIRYNRIEYHAIDDEIEDKDYLLCYTDGRSLLDACYEMILKLHELNLL